MCSRINMSTLLSIYLFIIGQLFAGRCMVILEIIPIWGVCKCILVYQAKGKCLVWERVQAFALVNIKPTCEWPQLGRQQRELTKLIRGGWHVKVSCSSGVSSITYVFFVVAEVGPLFVNWWRFAPPSLWVEALTCGGPDSQRKRFLCLPQCQLLQLSHSPSNLPRAIDAQQDGQHL